MTTKSEEELLEEIARCICDADEDCDGSWPENPNDDGYRPSNEPGVGAGYIRIVSPDAQDNYRNMAHAAWACVKTLAIKRYPK